MYIFIIIAVIYLITGWIRFSLEFHGDPFKQSGFIRKGEYLKYIFLWPLPMIFNKVAPILIDRSKQKFFEAEHRKESQDLSPELKKIQESYINTYSDTQRIAILCAFHHIATGSGTNVMSSNERDYIKQTSLFYDIPYNHQKFELLLQNKYADLGFVNVLKLMPEKDTFSCNLHTLLNNARNTGGEHDQYKFKLAQELLDKIGINLNQWKALILERKGGNI